MSQFGKGKFTYQLAEGWGELPEGHEFGQVAELGAARTFPSAMRWVDRHCAEMQRPMPVGTRDTDCSNASHLPAAA